MHNARRRAVVSASLVLLSAWGCGDGPPRVASSKTEATVKGTVTINGKLAAAGSVVFDPSNANRKDVVPATAPIGKDGSYSVKTYVGENRVSLSGKELISGTPELERERRAFDAQAGENTYNIDITIKK